ncbi:MAG: SIMPL domain-containing protein, partial [Gammaproteobacteria bacterium]
MTRDSSDSPAIVGPRTIAAALLGLLLAIGLVVAAWQIGQSIVAFRKLDRGVEVKGLSEREVPANLAIWPISYAEADNDVSNLYRTLESKNLRLVAFLQEAGFKPEEISVSPPTVVDKLAREYGGEERSQFRYAARSTVTVYTPDVARVR